MANRTVYPYGTEGQLPASIGIIDDLRTGGADKALSAEQGKILGGMVYGKSTAIDLSLITEQDCSLGANGWYYQSGIGRHKAIAVTPGEKILIKMTEYNGETSGNANGWYVFVTSSYSPPYSNGSSIPKIGTANRIGAKIGVEHELKAPTDSSYLIITTQDGAGVYPTWYVAKRESEGLDGQMQSMYNALGEGFFYNIQEIDLSEYTTQLCSLGGSGKWYLSGNAGRHKAVSVEPGQKLRLTFKTEGALGYYGFVSLSYSPPYANNATVPYAGGQVDRAILNYGSTITLTAPDDAGYLVVTVVDGGGNSNGWNIERLIEGEPKMGSVEEELLLIKGLFDGGDSKRDNTYTNITYEGEQIRIRMSNSVGIKTWNSMMSGQGMAISGNIIVRMRANTAGSTHYIYTVSQNETIEKEAEFVCSTAGHANALQFAPVIESGNDYPYLYVSDITTKCTVLSVDSSYNVTQVQTIFAPVGTESLQLLAGDDGYIWGLFRTASGTLNINKYRKVSVSEGQEVQLVNDDLLDSWTTLEAYPSEQYVMQGFKVKYGKLWHIIGTSGANQRRALVVYDLAAKRRFAHIDITSYANVEYEDIDFWDNAIILATWSSSSNTNTYIMRF